MKYVCKKSHCFTICTLIYSVDIYIFLLLNKAENKYAKKKKIVFSFEQAYILTKKTAYNNLLQIKIAIKHCNKAGVFF